MKLKRYILIKLDKLTIFHRTLFKKEFYKRWYKIEFKFIFSWNFSLFDVNFSYSLNLSTTHFLIDFLRFRILINFKYMRYGKDSLPF